MAKVNVSSLVAASIIRDENGQIDQELTKAQYGETCLAAYEEAVEKAEKKLQEAYQENVCHFESGFKSYLEVAAKWEPLASEAVLATFEKYKALNNVFGKTVLTQTAANYLVNEGKITINELDEANEQIGNWLDSVKGTVLNIKIGRTGGVSLIK